MGERGGRSKNGGILEVTNASEVFSIHLLVFPLMLLG